MKLRLFTIILLIIFFGIDNSLMTYAQSIDSSLNSPDFLITTDTPHPLIGDTVGIEAKSYVYDMDTMYLQWTINGRVNKSGVGEKFFEITFNGQPLTVMVEIIDTESKKTISQSITISNEQLIVLSQVEDALVTPFYKGKALPGPESVITYAIMPKNLLESGEYTWTFDYVKDLKNSGFNKSSITKAHSLLSRSTKINVEKRKLGIQKGFISFDQTFYDGILVWYPYLNSMLDIWNGSLNSITVTKSPVKIKNVSFNMSGTNQDILDYSYTLDSIKIPNKQKDKDILIFETNGESGTSTLRTNIEHPNFVGQFSENILKISY